MMPAPHAIIRQTVRIASGEQPRTVGSEQVDIDVERGHLRRAAVAPPRLVLKVDPAIRSKPRHGRRERHSGNARLLAQLPHQREQALPHQIAIDRGSLVGALLNCQGEGRIAFQRILAIIDRGRRLINAFVG
jgi:hypothetical protein